VIKKRGNRWWVVVYAGRDPLTGRKRQKTGTARRGELYSLRWSDVDFDQGDLLVAGAVIILPGQPLLDRDVTKTRTKRRVAVGRERWSCCARRVEQAKAALAAGAALGPDAYVFSRAPVGSKPIRPTESYGAMVDAARAGGRAIPELWPLGTEALAMAMEVSCLRPSACRIGRCCGCRGCCWSPRSRCPPCSRWRSPRPACRLPDRWRDPDLAAGQLRRAEPALSRQRRPSGGRCQRQRRPRPGRR